MTLDWKYGNFSLWEDYSPILRLGKGYNWVDFTFFNLSFEYEKHGPSFEGEVAILGVHVRLCIAMPWTTEQSEDLQRRFESIKTLPTECPKCKEPL